MSVEGNWPAWEGPGWLFSGSDLELNSEVRLELNHNKEVMEEGHFEPWLTPLLLKHRDQEEVWLCQVYGWRGFWSQIVYRLPSLFVDLGLLLEEQWKATNAV